MVHGADPLRLRMILYTPRRQKNFCEKLFQKTFLRRRGDRATGLVHPRRHFINSPIKKKCDVYCFVLLLFCFCSICHILFYIVPFSSYTPFLYRRWHKKFFDKSFMRKNEIVDFCIFTISVFEKHLKAVCKIQKRHAGDTKTFSKNFFVSPRSV